MGIPGSYGSTGAGYGDASTFPRTEFVSTRTSEVGKGHTVGVNLPILAFDDFAKLRPFCEVLEIEADVIGFCQVIQIARVEFEEISRGHRPYGGHVGVSRMIPGCTVGSKIDRYPPPTTASYGAHSRSNG